MIKIKYQDPKNLEQFIVEELDENIEIDKYCENLHKEKLCNTADCNGENCKIWMEVNGEFVLIGVFD